MSSALPPASDLAFWSQAIFSATQAREAKWGPFEEHPALRVDPVVLQQALSRYMERLEGNYPFFHPRYAGQMLKPPHPVAVLGYLAAMLVNPNNHALDGGPPTGAMEKEVVQTLAAMFHFPEDTLGHLTGGGTIANLEALWVARSLHPNKAVVCSEAAHYTHTRMGEVLGLEVRPMPTDAAGRMDLDALHQQLATGTVGTIVATAGTTGIGAVDPIEDLLPLAQTFGCRIHVDAAYGGFFSTLAWAKAGTETALDEEIARHFRAIAACDSVVVDPHKHGLQPYGCGAVLFRDPTVGRFYQHDSPYTYFSSDELHLGEISLECSRAGASAGAFWLTLQLLPLEADQGIGPILSAGLRAAQQWHAALSASERWESLLEPALDIVTYLPKTTPFAASAVDARSQQIFEQSMAAAADPVFLSVYRMDSQKIAGHVPGFEADRADTRILRSVLMKPTHETYLPQLLHRLDQLG